jgi:hypothetical protein
MQRACSVIIKNASNVIHQTTVRGFDHENMNVVRRLFERVNYAFHQRPGDALLGSDMSCIRCTPVTQMRSLPERLPSDQNSNPAFGRQLDQIIPSTAYNVVAMYIGRTRRGRATATIPPPPPRNVVLVDVVIHPYACRGWYALDEQRHVYGT